MMSVNKGWSDVVLEQTDGLVKPAFFEGVFDTSARWRAEISAMFENFAADRVPKVRAWVNGGELYSIADKLIAIADRRLDLQSRLVDATDSPSFCVTFNGLSAWSKGFAEETYFDIISPLCQSMGQAPLSGTDFYCFFGNYGFTPFGVHDDTDQSFLWHLGPGTKVAYVWPRDVYQRVTGGLLSTLEYDTLLPFANRYVLKPGDLLFIPFGDFHILETSDFSITLGLTTFPMDLDQDLTGSFQMLGVGRRLLEQSGDEAFSLNQLLALRHAALRSNGTCITPPIRRTPFPSACQVCNDDTVISSSNQWPVISVDLIGRSALVVRGRAMWSSQNSLFPKLALLLNSKPDWSFHQLKSELGAITNVSVLERVLQELFVLGGIEISSRALSNTRKVADAF